MGFSIGGLARGIGGAIIGGVTGGVGGAIVGGLRGVTSGGRRQLTAGRGTALQQATTSQGRVGLVNCGAGYYCVGAQVGGKCLGVCKPSTVGQPFVGGTPGPGGFGPMELPEGGAPVPQASGGCACNGGKSLCRCCTPSGQRGRFNKTGYWVYGRCGSPANATYVPPGSRCVSSRRINPANGRAARRAVQRVNATLNLLRSVEKSMARLTRGRKRG